jgi:ribonuclease HI
MKKIEIFTDGACRGNPGMGGWGALLRWQGHEKKLKGVAQQTTNNRMEMMAAIEALRSLKQFCCVAITTDSQYLQKGVTEWMSNWKKNQWRNSKKKPVKNKDLWQQLDQELQRHQVTWHWVRGHSGHVENELVDQLANEAIDEWEEGD